MAKSFATEMAQRAVDDAVQLIGGLGVLADHPVDRLYRAVRALRIYEGTTEIQQLIIAGELLEVTATPLAAQNSADTRLGRKIARSFRPTPANPASSPFARAGRLCRSRRTRRRGRAQPRSPVLHLARRPLRRPAVRRLAPRRRPRSARDGCCSTTTTPRAWTRCWRSSSSHRNIDVRLFNPFWSRRWRLLGYLTDFSRLNRRMHNKSFTVDDQVTIIGGRNIGDEYFGVGDEVQFVDLDVMAIGDVVHEVTQDFDRYWSYGSARPIERLLRKAGGATPSGSQRDDTPERTGGAISRSSLARSCRSGDAGGAHCRSSGRTSTWSVMTPPRSADASETRSFSGHGSSAC